MIKAILAVALLTFLGSAPALARDHDRGADEAQIRAIEQAQASAWNAHDIARYAALFSERADVVNVLGWWWKSRAELNAKLGAAHRSAFRDSHLDIRDVAIRFISPTTAIAHVRWTMAGAKSPTGVTSLTPQVGLQTQVLEKQHGAWLITVFQNTNSVPELPL
ncbi:MAG TPA: SgcJ/EcaC family oxidoreductase [Phenylobacterium sp.]|jgi:uncharacterized protein (TIGR02246 family)|nr:SgcJ/EcaC family oxidoreductase [Phenylobacterium sp.]